MSPTAESIVLCLSAELPCHLDGQLTVQRMKDSGSRNWRQMEWIGWYLEETGLDIIQRALGGRRGPSFGNTEFDILIETPMDLKAHVTHDYKGSRNKFTPLNDQSAIINAIEKYGRIGFVIFSGQAEFDHDGSFKQWHDTIKGKKSKYVVQRELDGRPSRMRKSGFTLEEIVIVEFTSTSDLDQGLREGWIKPFSQGRNSDGTPREPKFMLSLGDVPLEYITARADISSVNQ